MFQQLVKLKLYCWNVNFIVSKSDSRESRHEFNSPPISEDVMKRISSRARGN